MKHSVTCLGFPVSAEVLWLDDGADIGITGGCRTHVGAVTLAEPDGTLRTLLRDSHRDDMVSERWASVLAERWQVPVCVRCGIHYEGVSRERIDQIVSAAQMLLYQVINEETPGSGDL